jgi:small-conductance mechanosensitive channel
MLLLFVAPPVVAHPHTFRQLFSPDRWFVIAQHFMIDVLPKLVVIFVLAWVAVKVLGFFTDRMARIAEKHGSAATRISQARTLSSVLRATGIGIIGFLAVMMVLPILGFNLAPLLASAGVAGVAIGLACQTIVKDCLNGMLFLIEDQFNVGDWIVATGVTGPVEAMSLRKTTLRGGDGVLYLIPNSQITTVANKTRDFSVTTLSIEVDFSANPDEVIQVLTDAAMSVRNDPAFQDAFLADPSLLGVDDIKGSQVTYPIVMKTLANQQWGAKRELQRRIRLALEEHHMLPGDPLRVFTAQGPQALGVSGLPGRTAAPAAVDPTTIPSPEINPFTGQGGA